MRQERSIVFVPGLIWIALLLSFVAQCFWHHSFSNLSIEKKRLPVTPDTELIQLAFLDEKITSAKLIMLWLQAFDHQPGISIPLKELSYDKVIDWLNLILSLDNKTQYTLLAAIRFYAEVPDEEKQRKMIDFISEKFIEAPNRRWSSMAHAVYIAKHRLKDTDLALKCAHLIRQYAKGDNVPYWAKQMEIFVLEDMGELESAMVLIGGLLESGELTDRQQIQFLSQRLEEIKQRQMQK